MLSWSPIKNSPVSVRYDCRGRNQPKDAENNRELDHPLSMTRGRRRRKTVSTISHIYEYPNILSSDVTEPVVPLLSFDNAILYSSHEIGKNGLEETRSKESRLTMSVPRSPRGATSPR